MLELFSLFRPEVREAWAQVASQDVANQMPQF